jgi:transcriptional regulator with XRE-family HTH domain
MVEKTRENSREKPARDPLLVEIGARIRTIRLAIGMTQKDLADRAGVSPAYIYLVETGGQNLTITVLVRLAKSLGTSIEELLRGSTSGFAPSEESVANVSRILEKLEESVTRLRRQDQETMEKLFATENARREYLSGLVRELERLRAAHEKSVEILAHKTMEERSQEGD